MNKLKELRIKNNKTQAQMAKVLHISQSNYAKYENGQLSISNDNLITLANYYKTTIDFILNTNCIFNSVDIVYENKPASPLLSALNKVGIDSFFYDKLDDRDRSLFINILKGLKDSLDKR